jgi:uncharacterized protein YciW
MMVTPAASSAAAPQLGAEARLSIGLAVAQWMRSPRATSSARGRLRELGVADAEIERRRRAQSADRTLEGILRLAVTLVIAHGRLEPSDVRGLKPSPDAGLLREIAATVARTFYDVAIAESIDRSGDPTLDMQLGDY